MSRPVQIAIVALLAFAAGGWWWWSQHRASGPIAWQGYAEADYVKVGPTQPGQIVGVAVARGDAVTQGAPLFSQDDTEDLAARDQAARQLAQAQELLVNLQAGGKPTEIQQAQANLADARSTFARTQSDLSRGEAQLRIGGVSAQSVDQMRNDYLSAQAKEQALTAALAQSQAPMGREGEVAAQQAAVAAARAAVDMADWRLAQRRVAAPIGGRVADVMVRPGETIAAGAPVVSLLPPENIFVRFFVPETALASIHRGDKVALVCDSCPADLAATISFIAPQAEYTPPVIYSESSKSKLVFLVEARPPADQAALLNPGQPIEVRPSGTKPAP
jgi:HlyD family secretion protein